MVKVRSVNRINSLVVRCLYGLVVLLHSLFYFCSVLTPVDIRCYIFIALKSPEWGRQRSWLFCLLFVCYVFRINVVVHFLFLSVLPVGYRLWLSHFLLMLKDMIRWKAVLVVHIVCLLFYPLSFLQTCISFIQSPLCLDINPINIIVILTLITVLFYFHFVQRIKGPYLLVLPCNIYERDKINLLLYQL